MFVEINGLAYNLMFTQSIDKLDEDGKYKILYAISNENKLVEEFDNEADRDAKYEKAQAAGGASKEEIEHIEDEIERLKEVGFHPLKVEELPTEDIKDYILYLVPSDKPGEDNLCYEYLYINNAWEMVGTTSVDLSNYYTKDEVNNRIPIITCNVSQYASAGDTYYFSRDDLTNLQNVINEAKDFINNGIKLNLRATSYTDSGTLLNLIEISSTYYRFIYRGIVSSNGQTSRNMELIIRGSWNNDVFMVSEAQTTKTDYQLILKNDVLSKTNKTSYTPTSDYHPATKKYVDDAIAAAITNALGGSY